MDSASVGIAMALPPIRSALCITCERRWAVVTAGRQFRSHHLDDSGRGVIATLLGATEVWRFPVMSMTVTTSNYAPRERGRSAERGISLVELVIAITVLAVGMAGAGGVFRTPDLKNNRPQRGTTGTKANPNIVVK